MPVYVHLVKIHALLVSPKQNAFLVNLITLFTTVNVLISAHKGPSNLIRSAKTVRLLAEPAHHRLFALHVRAQWYYRLNPLVKRLVNQMSTFPLGSA